MGNRNPARNQPKNGFKSSWRRLFLHFLPNIFHSNIFDEFSKFHKIYLKVNKKWRKALFNLPFTQFSVAHPSRVSSTYAPSPLIMVRKRDSTFFSNNTYCLLTYSVYYIQHANDLPQTTVASSTGSLLQGSGHTQLAEVPSKEGTHLAYLGQLSFSQGSWWPRKYD